MPETAAGLLVASGGIRTTKEWTALVDAIEAEARALGRAEALAERDALAEDEQSAFERIEALEAALRVFVGDGACDNPEHQDGRAVLAARALLETP